MWAIIHIGDREDFGISTNDIIKDSLNKATATSNSHGIDGNVYSPSYIALIYNGN